MTAAIVSVSRPSRADALSARPDLIRPFSRRLGPWGLLLVGAVLVAVAPGCISERAAATTIPTGVDQAAFSARFDVADSLVLEEPGSVVTINPFVFRDPRGGFIVVENGEEQVRVYSATGALEDVFGEGTGRADSLRAPTGADRLPTGEVIATSLLSRRLTVVAPDHNLPVQTLETTLRLLEGVVALGDGKVLLTGPDAPYARSLLHIWDLDKGVGVRSFFPPPRQVDSNVVLVMGRVHTAMRGDRIAVVHSLSDTLFLFDRSGVPEGTVPIPVAAFDVPKGGLPRINSLEKRRAWTDQWTVLSDVWWIADSVLVVQWSRGRKRHATYGLIQLDLTGKVLWFMDRTPRLMDVRQDRYIFQDPRADSPNIWIVALERAHQ